MPPTDQETPTNEENVPPKSPKSQKDGWDKWDIVAKWVSACAAVFVPILIGVVSCQIQNSLSEQSARIQKSIAQQSLEMQKSIAQQSLAKDYVGFAISILERPEQEGNSDLREWATKLLVNNAPEEDKFDPKAQEQLKRLERFQSGAGPLNERFEHSFSPDRKKAALIAVPTAPSMGWGWRNVVSIFDLQTEFPIATFDAGVGYDYPPRLVWSRDSLKLAISFNSPYGKVVVYDLSGPPYKESDRAPYPSVGKSLGEYQTKPSNGQIDSLSFSEDARSVSIKMTGGQIEVWQLP